MSDLWKDLEVIEGLRQQFSQQNLADATMTKDALIAAINDIIPRLQETATTCRSTSAQIHDLIRQKGLQDTANMWDKKVTELETLRDQIS